MKLKELQKVLREKKLDAAIILKFDPSYFYFLQTKSMGALIVFARKKPLLLINNLESLSLEIKQKVYKDFWGEMQVVINKNKLKKIGISLPYLSVTHYRKYNKLAKIVDINNDVKILRETKTSEELSKIKKAILLSEEVLSDMLNNFDFKTEGDIKQFIKIEAIKKGCELSFEPIVASGKNAAIPHYEGNQKLKKGFLVIDMGLKYEGYCADITRTFFVGKPSQKQADFYYKLLWIQEEAIKFSKPGMKVADIDKKVRDLMRNDSKYFIHGLGHGLGSEVHESPSLSSKSEDVLKEGMVITIEPGYYNKFGIRIEDDVLITKKGAKVLSIFTKELMTIDL